MQTIDDFKQHLIASGKSEHTASLYAQRVASFLHHLAERSIEMTEEVAWSYVAEIKDRRRRRGYAVAIGQFLKFAAQMRLLVNIGDYKSSRTPVPSQNEAALPQQWLIEKLIEEKSRADDLIARLGYKLMEHYLYFRSRTRGNTEKMDNVYRLADEAKQLMEENLALFIRLSSGCQKNHRTVTEFFSAAARRLGSQAKWED